MTAPDMNSWMIEVEGVLSGHAETLHTRGVALTEAQEDITDLKRRVADLEAGDGGGTPDPTPNPNPSPNVVPTIDLWSLAQRPPSGREPAWERTFRFGGVPGPGQGGFVRGYRALSDDWGRGAQTGTANALLGHMTFDNHLMSLVVPGSRHAGIDLGNSIRLLYSSLPVAVVVTSINHITRGPGNVANVPQTTRMARFREAASGAYDDTLRAYLKGINNAAGMPVILIIRWAFEDISAGPKGWFSSSPRTLEEYHLWAASLQRYMSLASSYAPSLSNLTVYNDLSCVDTPGSVPSAVYEAFEHDLRTIFTSSLHSLGIDIYDSMPGQTPSFDAFRRSLGYADGPPYALGSGAWIESLADDIGYMHSVGEWGPHTSQPGTDGDDPAWVTYLHQHMSLWGQRLLFHANFNSAQPANYRYSFINSPNHKHPQMGARAKSLFGA